MKPYLFAIMLFPLAVMAGPGKKKIQARPAEVGGKMVFASSPVNSGTATSKTSFTSGEYIYGRLEVSGGSLKEAFKLTEIKGHYFLMCEIEVLKDGQPVGYHTSKNNHFLLSDEQLNKNWVNFDVLPEMTKVSSLYSMTEDFSAGYGYSPMYDMINPDYFPEAGNYRINIKFLSITFDAYEREHDKEKWPFMQDGFDFTLQEADIARLRKDGMTIRIAGAKNAFRYDKLPSVFTNPGKLTDPNATTAKVAAILKRDLSDRAIIKWVAESYSGVQWNIATNELGIPTYKYFNPHIWMAYKANGQCYVGYVTLRQTYNGGGTYGPLQVAWTSTKDDRVIDCAKVK